MSMLVPLQAHTNVRDVLAPLFCNGRSFANLIDELSRHFKFESSQSQSWRVAHHSGHHGAHTHDVDDDAVLEASSESQSTDSEAEGNISDEADDRLVQARVSAQSRAHASATTNTGRGGHTTTTMQATDYDRDDDRHRAEGYSHGLNRLRQAKSNTAPASPPASTTTARTSPPECLTRTTGAAAHPGDGPSTMVQPTTACLPPGSGGPAAQPSMPASTPAASTSPLFSRQAGAVLGGAGAPASSIPARLLPSRGKGTSRGSKGGLFIATSTNATSGSSDNVGPPPLGDSGGDGGGMSGVGGGGSSSTAVGGGSKGTVSGDDLTVMSVAANADGWSEAVGAALATRVRAGYVFAQEVDPDSPLSTEFLREEFTDERSGTRKALEVRMRLIPASKKVLLCSAWVDSGEYLAGAAKLVAQCQAEVFGIACVRFEQNSSTQGLVDRFNVYAKSMPKGSVPSLNIGMKSCIPASFTKGFHGYTYNRVGKNGGTWVLSEGRPNGGVAGGVASTTTAAGGMIGSAGAVAPAGTEVRQDRARKRRRSRRNGTDSGPSLSPEDSAPIAETAMDDGKGGPPAGPAADEVSAGEGLADPGDGGEPAGERFGGGGVSESVGGSGSGGVVGGGGAGSCAMTLIGGALCSGEEGDYAADSERSTDHEWIYVGGSSGSGGGRESDEHDLSEREREMVDRGGRRRGNGSVRAGGVAPRCFGAGAGGRRTRARSATRSDYRGLVANNEASGTDAGVDKDGGNSSSRNSDCEQQRGSWRGGVSTPKRRRVASGGGRRGVGSRGSPDEMQEADKLHRLSSHGEDVNMSRNEGSVMIAIGVLSRAVSNTDIDVDDPDHESDRSQGAGHTTSVEQERSVRREYKPIFMSRGQTSDDVQLSILPCHSGGDDHELPGRGRGRGRPKIRGDDGLKQFSCQPPQDPESDLVRPETPKGKGNVGGGPGDAGGPGVGRIGGRDIAASNALNAPGGPVPWHHTSVYEANDPTEDRHVELANEGLGVRIYCVCDGHGGSRAAQFVCDNLAKDVLARVEAMAEVWPRTGPRPAACATGRDGSGSGKAGGRGLDDHDVWSGVEEEEVRRSLTQAFASCDERFIAQLDPKKNRGYINAGCCVVLALFIRSKLYVAHAGDCRAVLSTTDPGRFPADVTATHNVPAPSGAGSTAVNTNENRTGAAANGRGLSNPAGGTGRAVAGELTAVALSRDHNCDDDDEVALVRARSGDENPIRVSRNDEWKGARAIKRVAGSLAVTRAIGDAYLKEALFSFSPYKEGVPYITSEPVVTALDLTPADVFLVLATDGIWEQVSNEEAVRCVSSALSSGTSGGGAAGGRGGSSPLSRRRQRASAAGGATSDALVNFVLARSAQGHGMTVPALRALPKGPSRRMLHDDMCATVVHLTHVPLASQSSL